MSNRVDNLRNYLEWLITPQDAEESDRFKELNLVDGYIDIKSRIDSMSEVEFIEEIDKQIKGFGLEISTTDT